MGLRVLQFVRKTTAFDSASINSQNTSSLSVMPRRISPISSLVIMHTRVFRRLVHASPGAARAVHRLLLKTLQRCEAHTPPPANLSR